MLLRSPNLARRSVEMLVRLAPKIKAVTEGRPAMLSPDDIAAAEKLLDMIAANASPKLQTAVGQVRTDLRSGRLNDLFASKSAGPSVRTVSLVAPGRP